MTDCNHLDSRLEAYLAGALEPAECDALEEHAAGCERCAPILEERTRVHFHLARELPPPASVRADVMQGLRARRSARVTSLIARRIIPIAAAAAALLFFGVARPRTKAAMMRDMASTSSSQLAVLRADPAFATLAQAQLELRAARDGAAPDARARLEQALARMSEKEAELRSLIREFEQ